MTPQLERRKFIRGAVVSAGLTGLWDSSALAATKSGSVTPTSPRASELRPIPATGFEHEACEQPALKRAPFGWKVTPIPNTAKGLVLKWRATGNVTADRFRFTVGLDEREPKKVEVRLAESGRVLGVMDIRYGCFCQMFELMLSPADVAAALKEGLRLRVLEERSPLWIFGGIQVKGVGHDYLLPHLLGSDDYGIWNPAFARLASLASVQPFGWIEGCVVEGLSELANSVPTWSGRATMALDQHLDLFFPGDQMIMEDPRSAPSDGKWFSIEANLMLPSLARRRLKHAFVKNGFDWMLAQPMPKRDSSNGSHSEGCYTLAYAIAQIARLTSNEQAMNVALDHLIFRKHQLIRGETFYQRNWGGGRGHAGENWSRGMAWYMLGYCRVLQLAGTKTNARTKEAAEELERMSRWVVQYQRQDGLWTCYAHQPETGPETSGTAGIAAALLLAHDLGCASKSVMDVASRALKGLERYLSPDGFLNGVTQSNKGGDELQRSGFRVYMQMGLGLAVQLAALHRGR